MGLYNALFGVNDEAGNLVKLLRVAMADFEAPRFRDCYFDGTYIVVHTRTGGGNRDYYESAESCRDNYPEYFGKDTADAPSGPWNDDLRKHSWFSHDADDDFDSTYADFYFTPPAEIAATLTKADTTPAERWQAMFAQLSAGKMPPNAQKVADDLLPKLAAALDGTGPSVIEVGPSA